MDTGRFRKAISRSVPPVPDSQYIVLSDFSQTKLAEECPNLRTAPGTHSRRLDYGRRCQYIRISESFPSVISQKTAPFASIHSPVRRRRNTALNSDPNQGPAR